MDMLKLFPLFQSLIPLKHHSLPSSNSNLLRGRHLNSISSSNARQEVENNRNCYSTQLIDREGTFNVAGIENFAKKLKLPERGLSYAVVSIMGPQSSGKSTLLNHLFGTDFREMDALKGRYQTTKGIWIATCPFVEPCTLVMDLEGTDGYERGEDDTAFEKQTALFALAVSDIVIINMWCHDIGREQAANRPLLKTVFRVMMRLFSPRKTTLLSPRKTTLLFVIRDQTKTPLKELDPLLRQDIQEIWDSVPKRQAHMETPLNEFFNVEVVALANYEYNEEKFKEQVAELRKKFIHSITSGGLAAHGAVPASTFSFSSQEIWNTIKENKDLNLPALKVMVATVKCEEIANKKSAAFAANECCRLQKDVQVGHITGFKNNVNSLVDACLEEYDAEATYFDNGVRSAKRKQLKEKLFKLVEPEFQSALGHVRSKTLDKSKKAFWEALNTGEGISAAASNCVKSCVAQFDKACKDVVVEQANWDTSKVREKLRRDIDAHVASVHAAKISDLISSYETKLKEALSGPVEALFDGANRDTWSSIRNLLGRETESAVAGFSSALSGFDMDEETRQKMILSLRDYARGLVEGKAREEAGRVLIRMKDRFTMLFSHDSDSMPRVWTRREDIRAVTKTARTASLKLLAVLAAIRLDDNNNDHINIEETLEAALIRSPSSAGLLASSSWKQVPPSKTLIIPLQCKDLWRRFLSETECFVLQASAEQAREAAQEPKGRIGWKTYALAFILVLGLIWYFMVRFSCSTQFDGHIEYHRTEKKLRNKPESE